MKLINVVPISVLFLGGCAPVPPDLIPAAEAALSRPSDQAAGTEGLVAVGGELVRQWIEGSHLIRVPVPAPGPVVHVFGQSLATGDALVLVAGEEGTRLYRVSGNSADADLVCATGVVGAGWSPQGHTFFYISTGGELVMVEGDQSGVRAAGVFAASFSPDGQRLALLRRPGHPGKIPDRMDPGPDPLSPAFSRGGLSLLDLGSGRESVLTHQVTSTRWTLGDAPWWSPDGRQILYLGGDGEQVLWRVFPESGTVAPVQVEGGFPAPVTPLYWSPQGDRAYFGAETLDEPAATWVLELREGRTSARRLEDGHPRYRTGSDPGLILEGESGTLRLDLGTGATRFLTEQAVSGVAPALSPSGAYDVTYYWPLTTTAHANISSWMSHSSSSSGCADGGSRYDCACNGSSCRTGHKGTDIAVPLGTSILSAEAGTVVGVYGGCGSTTSCTTTNTGCNGGAGNYVVVQHSNGAVTRYLHQKGTVATYGASVSPGALLGYVGSTGNSTGCHLHFDIAYGGVVYDPYYGACSCTSQSLWKSSSSPPPTSPTPDLYGMLLSNTGTSSTEVHALTGTSKYQSWLMETGTALHETSRNSFAFDLGDFDRDGKADLYAIAMNGTGSGKVEVHLLSGASGFQQWILHAATPLAMTTPDRFAFEVGDYDQDGRPDLFAIKMVGGSGSTEVHVLSGASNYQTWGLQTVTALHVTNWNSWAFDVGDFNRDGRQDVYAIAMNGTGSGYTEVHILNGANGYQNFLLQTATILGPTSRDQFNFSLADYNRDGRTDLYALKLYGTGSGKVEAHILSGAANYRSWLLQTGTPAPTASSTWWWWEAY